MRMPERGDKVSEVFHALLKGPKVTIHPRFVFKAFRDIWGFLVTHLLYLKDLELLRTDYDSTLTVGDSVLL